MLGVVSVWSVLEVNALMPNEFDLNINLGGKFKMSLVYTDNLFECSSVINRDSIFDSVI